MGYQELYIAIWENAIREDIANVKSRLKIKGFNIAYKVYIEKTNVELETNDKRFNQIKKDISDYINLKSGDIEKRIKQLVWEETQAWPENKNLKITDEEYKTLYEKLEHDVVRFAKERMEKRWYKI